MTSELRAEKIGSLLFCPRCGSLLPLPVDEEPNVTCEACQFEESATSYEGIKIRTKSHPDAFPSALRQKRKTQTKAHEESDMGTLVTEKCPQCGHLGAWSKEMQLRSADEGATIFYTCASCKHGWRVNN